LRLAAGKPRFGEEVDDVLAVTVGVVVLFAGRDVVVQGSGVERCGLLLGVVEAEGSAGGV